jgi:hypothetical protein
MVAIIQSRHTHNQNHLLAALPAEVMGRISSHLELVLMPLGNVLYESGELLQYVYFPATAIMALVQSNKFTTH